MLQKKFLLGVISLSLGLAMLTAGCDLFDTATSVKKNIDTTKQAVTDTVDYVKEVKGIHDIFTERFLTSTKTYHDNMSKLLDNEKNNGDMLSKAKLDEFIAINKTHKQELDSIERDLNNLNVRTDKGNEMRTKVKNIVATERNFPELQLQLTEGNIKKLIDQTDELEKSMQAKSNALEELFKSTLK